MGSYTTKFGGKLPTWEKGQSGNPNGRPKKVHSQLLKTKQYSLSEINDVIQTLVSMTTEQLNAVSSHKDATILEKTVAQALKKSLSKGDLVAIETLLNRVYGKPKEKVDITSKGQKLDSNNKIEIEIIHSNNQDGKE